MKRKVPEIIVYAMKNDCRFVFLVCVCECVCPRSLSSSVKTFHSEWLGRHAGGHAKIHGLTDRQADGRCYWKYFQLSCKAVNTRTEEKKVSLSRAANLWLESGDQVRRVQQQISVLASFSDVEYCIFSYR